MTLAIWRVPDCPLGEWALGIETGGTLHILKYFTTKDEALDRLAQLEDK